MTYKETMTAAPFITFLERMLSETTQKIFLIVDRLRAHEVEKGGGLGRGASGSDRVILPANGLSSSGRNADEYLNNDMKKVDQRVCPAGESRRVVLEDRGVNDQVVGARSRAVEHFEKDPGTETMLWKILKM